MEIENIKIVNIRNFESKELIFSKKNYITGANGAGKTTVLESIVLSMTKRSFRSANLGSILSRGKSHGIIRTEIKKKDVTNDLTLKINNKKKNLFINGKKAANLYELAKNYPVFFHSPYYEGITDKKNQKRLNFIDRILILIKKEYGILLKNHNRLIAQKKNLIHEGNFETINVYNEIISDIYSKIFRHRENVVKLLNEHIGKVTDFKFELIKRKKDDLMEKEKIYKKVFFSANAQKVHIVDNNGETVDDTLSFGQKKELSIYTIYFAVKIVEEYLKDDIIILLDDFEAGLDERRVKSFYDNLSDNQIIITGVENRFLKNINIINL